MDAQVEQVESAAEGPAGYRVLRFRTPDRAQTQMVPLTLDDSIPPDHEVRVLWEVADRLDLTAFAAGLKVSEGGSGRSATDVRLLVSLWLYASTQGIGSARELERLCTCHDAYRWLCGGVRVNHHTLSDFRVSHERALDGLLTEVLAMLMDRNLVAVKRISQDGLRVRASAGTSSFRKEERLKALLAEARQQVESLKAQREAPAARESTASQKAARQRAARERAERVQQALVALEDVKKIKAKHNGKKNDNPPRASTTDPEARKMKMPNGGFNAAYNVQVATDTASRAVVGVAVTNEGTDKAQSEPMRQQVQERTGQAVEEHLVDGGFVKLEQIERAQQAGVRVYAPPQQSSNGVDPCQAREADSPEIAAWRQRMASAEGKTIYKMRAATSETVNADLRTYRGVDRFGVRGLGKVRSVVLWSVLAYNLMHFGRALLS
jgi:transposase